MRVLIADPISKSGIETLSKYCEVDVKTGLSKEDLLKIIPYYDALVVRSETKVDRDVISAGKNLKIIGRAGVGVDNIDVDSATERGIIVVNAPEGNTISACEHTFALMLSLARNIPDANASLKRGEWKRKEFIGVELYGKTLGVIGLGRIGLAVSQRALSFGMEVIGYDPYISKERITEMGIKPVSLDELYANSDFITIHTPLTADTKNLIDRSAFLKMKRGVRIINCARGGIINEQDLIWAIEEGIVAGAAIDVFEKEPPPSDSPILKNSKIIVTPHLGASTVEAQERVAQIVIEDILRMLRGEPVKNGVNIGTVRNPEIFPFMRLGELLGKFAVQLMDVPVNRIDVIYSGKITEYDCNPITASVISGVLQYGLTVPVNIVNAFLIAKQRGVSISERRISETEGFENLLTLELNGKLRVSGTLLENKEARLIRYNNYYLNVAFSNHMLFTEHIDVPGIIGKIGTILGVNNINIGFMQVGRSEKDAVMILSVDSPVGDEILKEIRKIENIKLVRRINLGERKVEED
jgi:D-3-phosphoglycerate dehydrogenase